MYICIYVYMYICKYAYMYMYVYMYICEDTALLVFTQVRYPFTGMPWHAVACRGMPCHDLPWHAMACRGMPWLAAMACHGLLWHAMACRGMPRHAMAWDTNDKSELPHGTTQGTSSRGGPIVWSCSTSHTKNQSPWFVGLRLACVYIPPNKNNEALTVDHAGGSSLVTFTKSCLNGYRTSCVYKGAVKFTGMPWHAMDWDTPGTIQL